ncbi:hypothetical protein KBX06_02875 [Micromonospora sp. C31]|uniref:hypothetical protein n=1 Tax=Micromonospora sp. C31 TaxID=2824876 RepID=UPI001B3663AB|nr:hypothetical protein [Micromonospora sp. C31]MBQ1072114.1 hypothetical protein [Micromonospora sp. C31]
MLAVSHTVTEIDGGPGVGEVYRLRAMMFDTPPEQLVAVLVSWAIGLAVLYLVIRLAVRHAIADADRRRARTRD